ncbi:MAG: Family ership [Actinomycetota bacterium]|jgi:beta-glucosidase
MTQFEADVQSTIAKLSLEEKIRLLSGEDAWSTYALENVDLRKMILSDGPSGVRGSMWDERYKSLTLPSASCVSATWDLKHLYSIGEVSANEARSKGVSVVLGPTINLHRSPRGGRHFEAYSEDPFLSGKLAASYIKGVQDNGVAATAKHYVANDSENERMTVDVQMDEQTLHELYLAPFEIAIREAKLWALMASYNSINGTTATEHKLLEDPLRSEWGFDGLVMSDWTAIRSVEESANAAIDLAMPGSKTPWSEGLLAAVEAGRVSEKVIDEKVGNILTLAKRVGALGSAQPKIVNKVDGRKVIRKVAADGFVLVENNGVLPLKPNAKNIAVIGSHSIEGRIGGGGSAMTFPHNPVSPINGLISNAPAGTTIVSEIGYHSVDELTDLPLAQILSPSGDKAMQVEYFDEAGSLILSEDRFGKLILGMSENTTHGMKKIVAKTAFTAVEDGLHRFGVAGIGHAKLTVNGAVVMDEDCPLTTHDLLEAMIAAPEKNYDIALVAGQKIELEFEYIKDFPFDFDGYGVQFGYRAPRLDAEVDLQKAVAAAKEADVAVVVVGTTAHVESEGYDRSSMKLPGRQDELVRAVAAANPNTIVVINAGSPVEMPWRKDVAGVLLTWFPGEEYGNALADVVYGHSEPGGRLPTTWGATLDETPITNTDPTDGALVYTESLNIGYRAWAKANRTPAYHFGYGLGYTTFELSKLEVVAQTRGAKVNVELTNTGSRDGSDVVQVYLRKTDSSVKRPEFWLAGFAKLEVAAGQSTRVQIELDESRFAHYSNGWQLESGNYEVLVSRSADLTNALKAAVSL